MLESIRSGAQSLGVKIAFGVIILVFVFWGVGNFNDRDYSNVVAVVNGEPIVALEFEKAYYNTEEYLLRNNPGLTREELAKQHLGRQVLNDLIRATLLAQEARRAGITVSPLELRQAVGQTKAFQDEQGRFDPEAYKRVLANQRLTPAQYEKNLADEILRTKMFGLVTAPAWIDPDEALHRFNFLRERRIIDYDFLPAQKFAAEVKLEDNEAREWYENHPGDFAIPPMVDVAYIMVMPESLVDRDKIPEAAAREWYEANKSKYERPERIHARHILVPLAQDADEAATREAEVRLVKAREALWAGRSFAQVADEINQPDAADKGGDLGWIARGQTVPEFEEAAFALPAGTVSGPVRTPFGLHLVLVEEKQEAGTAPFEEVAEEARRAIAFEEGSEKLHEALDNLIEDNILQKPLDQAAARYGLKAEQSGLLDRQGLIQKFGIKPEAADSLLAVPAGAPLDTALEAGNNYIIARIARAEPAGTKPFDSVSGEISENLIQAKALTLAMDAAKAQLEKIRNEKPAQVKNLKTSPALERGGIVPGFAPEPSLMEAIFATRPETWMAAPVEVRADKGGPGAFFAYIDRLVPPEPGEYDAVAGILGNAGRQERQEGIYGLFIQHLAQNADVKITNPDLVDRVNM